MAGRTDEPTRTRPEAARAQAGGGGGVRTRRDGESADKGRIYPLDLA